MASERDPGVERIIAFSDGVVAIAITLLILPLTEIDRAEDATLGDVITDNQTALFAFALSFAVIANYWTIHHSILQPLRGHDRRLIQLNLLWLALIVFLPFPTALIADGLDGGFATLYIGALLAVSILGLLLVTYLAHHPELTDGEATAESRGHLTASWFSIAALVVALVISFFSAAAGIWALLLLIPSQMVAGRLSNKTVGVPPSQP